MEASIPELAGRPAKRYEQQLKQKDMRERIKSLLEDALPLVNLESDFLFSELDSLAVIQILMILSEEYGIELTHTDATPKNLKTLDSIVSMVQRKIEEKQA